MIYNTNPWSNDTDLDLLSDYEEIFLCNTSALTNMTFPPIPDIDYDYDGDGLGNLEELRIYFSMPNNNDTDHDNATDGWEVIWHFNPLNSSDGSNDRDGDGLLNWEEEKYGTSPNETDSDRDGFSDAWEVQWQFDPTDKNVPLSEYLIGYLGYEIIAVIGVIAIVVGYRAILLKEKSNVRRKLHEEDLERKKAFDELANQTNDKDDEHGEGPGNEET